jgi:hypothetical protein
LVFCGIRGRVGETKKPEETLRALCVTESDR